MADRELVQFETAVEKLVAQYASKVNGLIEDAKNAVDKEVVGLCTSICALKPPKDAKADDIQDIVDSSIKSETKRIVRFTEIMIKMRVDGGKLKGNVASKGLLNSF